MNRNKDIKCFFIYGNDAGIKADGNTIIAPCKETRAPGILNKTIHAFKHVTKKYEYDYIFRTNLSSFVLLDRIGAYLDTLPDKNCYCSEFHYPNPVSNRDVYPTLKKLGLAEGFGWGNGAGIILSRDLVQNIINNEKKLHKRLIDDVSLGVYLHKLSNVEKIKQLRYKFVKYQPKKVVTEEQLSKGIRELKSSNHFHVRIKNPANRNRDIEIQKRLFNIFYK